MSNSNKAKAPLLGLIYNLVFDKRIYAEFIKSPKKVAEVFGLSDDEYNEIVNLQGGTDNDGLANKLAEELKSTLSKPALLIPNSELYTETPTISAVYNLLHDGSVSDYLQRGPKEPQCYKNFFDTFGISNPIVQESFETYVPEVGVMSAAMAVEVAEVVHRDFSKNP